MAANNVSTRPQSVALFDDSPIKYRGFARSSIMNSLLNSLRKTVVRSIVRAQRSNQRLDDINRAISLESRFVSAKLSKIVSLSNTAQSIITMHDLPADAPTGEEPTVTINNIQFESLFGQISMFPIKSLSKLKTFENELGERRPTPDISIFFAEHNDGDTVSPAFVDFDDEIYNIVDGTTSTAWVKEIDSGTDRRATIELRLPKSITPLINTITLHPFPSFSTRIEKIEYLDSRGSFQEINTGRLGGSGVREDHGGPIKVHFRPYSYSDAIRITMRAMFPEIKSNSKSVIGLSNVDVSFEDYNNSTATVFYDFPGTGIGLSTDEIKIDNFELDFYFDNGNMTLVDYKSNPPLSLELWTQDGLLTTIPSTIVQTKIGTEARDQTLGDIYPTPIPKDKRLKLKLQFREVNLTTPVIRGAKLLFHDV